MEMILFVIVETVLLDTLVLYILSISLGNLTVSEFKIKDVNDRVLRTLNMFHIRQNLGLKPYLESSLSVCLYLS